MPKHPHLTMAAWPTNRNLSRVRLESETKPQLQQHQQTPRPRKLLTNKPHSSRRLAERTAVRLLVHSLRAKPLNVPLKPPKGLGQEHRLYHYAMCLPFALSTELGKVAWRRHVTTRIACGRSAAR